MMREVETPTPNSQLPTPDQLPTPAYRYSQTIGMFTEVGRGFSNPYDVAPAADGRLFVINRSNGFDAPVGGLRIAVLTVDEEYLGDFGTYGTEPGGLVWPNSIALDSRGRLYVSDEWRHDVQVFEPDGTFVRAWGGPGEAEGRFNRASGLAIDRDGTVLVADAGNHRIQRFDQHGRLLATWGTFGSDDGQLNMPWGVAVDGESRVYVSDWRNDRVQKFDRDGRHVATFGRGVGSWELGVGDQTQPDSHAGQFKRPAGLAVDRDGNVIVADWGNDRVQILRPDGSHVVTLTGDATLSRWAAEFLESSADVMAQREVAAEPEQERRFWGVTSVKVDGEGRLFAVESCRHRIQVYRRAT